MTKHDKQIFDNDIQRRYEELIETGQYTDEEAIEIATDDAEMAYDDHQDNMMEDEREKDWE